MDTTLAQAFPRCVKKYYNIYTRERKALGKGCPKYFGTCRKKVRQMQRKWLGPAFPTGILAFSTACRKRNLLNKRWEGRSVWGGGAAGAQSAHKGQGDHRAPALWFDSQGPKAPWPPNAAALAAQLFSPIQGQAHLHLSSKAFSQQNEQAVPYARLTSTEDGEPK